MVMLHPDQRQSRLLGKTGREIVGVQIAGDQQWFDLKQIGQMGNRVLE